MTSIERIGEMKKIYSPAVGPRSVNDLFYMIRAFEVMMKIAEGQHSDHCCVREQPCDEITEMFEKRMLEDIP